MFSDRVAIILNGTLEKELPLHFPELIAISPSGSKIYITQTDTTKSPAPLTLASIDGVTNAEGPNILICSNSTSSSKHAVTFSADGSKANTACGLQTKTITVINASTDELQYNITLANV